MNWGLYTVKTKELQDGKRERVRMIRRKTKGDRGGGNW